MANRYAAALGRIGARVRLAKLSPQRRREVSAKAQAAHLGGRLPERLRPLFPAHCSADLRLPHDKDTILEVVLLSGEAEHLAWLRRRIGEAEIHRWIHERRSATT
jgi:hypothetical protein